MRKNPIVLEKVFIRKEKWDILIDIDEGALEHAKENATLNGLECLFGKNPPLIDDSTPLILMNMISSEQKIAWKALPLFSQYTLITSGFPENEKEPQNYGALIDQISLEGWKGFLFQKT